MASRPCARASRSRYPLAVPGTAGAIGVALLTGLRGALPDQIWDQWAIAGIAHLLSISGLHLALVAGTLFFTVRIALALAPPLALRLPTKKLAALIALFGAFGYLLLSGAPVPTQRAFAMTALGLVAIMADRNPFSMRLVTWAAIVVLLLQPESLLGASFQMSFGAVVALIAVYETGVARRPAEAGGLDWRLLMYVGGIALTTLVASTATTPFSIYHFSRFPTYGIATNLIAVPLTGIWIMPWGMLGLLLDSGRPRRPCSFSWATGSSSSSRPRRSWPSCPARRSLCRARRSPRSSRPCSAAFGSASGARPGAGLA